MGSEDYPVGDLGLQIMLTRVVHWTRWLLTADLAELSLLQML